MSGHVKPRAIQPVFPRLPAALPRIGETGLAGELVRHGRNRHGATVEADRRHNPVGDPSPSSPFPKGLDWDFCKGRTPPESSPTSSRKGATTPSAVCTNTRGQRTNTDCARTTRQSRKGALVTDDTGPVAVTRRSARKPFRQAHHLQLPPALRDQLLTPNADDLAAESRPCRGERKPAHPAARLDLRQSQPDRRSETPPHQGGAPRRTPRALRLQEPHGHLQSSTARQIRSRNKPCGIRLANRLNRSPRPWPHRRFSLRRGKASLVGMGPLGPRFPTGPPATWCEQMIAPRDALRRGS